MIYCLPLLGCLTQGEPPMPERVPENVYRGELIAYPGPWAFDIGRAHIILVSDQELEALSDPDEVLNLSLTFDKNEASLRQICERAQAAGQRTLVLAFDHFFKQYRPGQDQPRRLTPDMDEYIQRIAAIGEFAEGYGLGLELSLLSPLEIGPARPADGRLQRAALAAAPVGQQQGPDPYRGRRCACLRLPGEAGRRHAVPRCRSAEHCRDQGGHRGRGVAEHGRRGRGAH
jgi:hypothetical protein